MVWDAQTDHLYFFLLHDWLSVENESDGAVEKKLLASCKPTVAAGVLWPWRLLFTVTCALFRSRGAYGVSEGPGLPAGVRDDGTPHVAVPVGTSCTQLCHQGSEDWLQCHCLTPLPGTGGSLVWGRGHRGPQV